MTDKTAATVDHARGRRIHRPEPVPAAKSWCLADVARMVLWLAADDSRRMYRPAVDRGRRLDVTEARHCTEVCTEHGEGPFWDTARGRLLVVDMLAGAIVEVRDDGSTERHERGGVVATIRARRRGGYVIATERGFPVARAGLRTGRRRGDRLLATRGYG